MNYKIYKIQRIDTSEIVYIGITRSELTTRLKQHLRDKRNNKKKANYFKKYKDLIEIVCLESNINNLKEANEKEILYIKKYRDLGCKLLNATDGGDGTLNLQSWNKGVKCTYIDKLMNNSPNAKKIYSYDYNGNFLNEYNSIKKASESLNIPRSAIKNICELKKGSITYKNLTFRYLKEDKIIITRVSKEQRIKNIITSKINNCKRVIIFDKKLNKQYIFKNYLECIDNFKIKKSTLYTYLSIQKETKKYKFYYET
jgi:hypothetical protein